jgi:glycosyltransferase involved in cell wall biosynthesis
MNWARDCAVIVPCLNEAGRIGKVVRGVRMHLPTVIVVDDGSSDGTAAEAAMGGAEVLIHSCNHGKGAALQSGFKHVRSRGYSWALTLDGDGQHHPDDIPNLLVRADESRGTLVVGNRLNAPQAMPWVRRSVNHWMSLWLSRLAGELLADSQCGLRLVSLDAWSKLELRTEHFEFESELLIEFVRAGHKVEFVPVRVIYSAGHSHIRPLTDTFRWFRWWLKQRPVKAARSAALQEWVSRQLPGLQHDSRSVRESHIHVVESGLQSKTVQFGQAKAAFD